MECLRKAGEKSKESKNRMPSIFEAVALAVATTVKPHSLTHNTDGNKTNISNAKAITLTHLLERDIEKIKSFYGKGEWIQSSNDPPWLTRYDQVVTECPDNKNLYELQEGFSFKNFLLEDFLSILDAITKVLTQCDPYFKPYFFIDNLRIIQKTLCTITKEDDRYDPIFSKAVQYMKVFSELHPDFLKDFDGFQEQYNIWIEFNPPTTLLTHWKENHVDKTVSLGGQGGL